MYLALTSSAIQPRLISLSLREPSARSADGDIHDQVEFLIERRGIGIRRVRPGILEWHKGTRGAVHNRRREVALVEERLVERDRQKSVQTTVH